MSILIVDTNVIIRMKGIYNIFTMCFEKNNDVIMITKEIMKECNKASKTSMLIVQSFLSDLKNRGKLKIINKGRIDAKFKQYTKKKLPSMPKDSSDIKFITLAVALKSNIIVSGDKHLKDLNPIRWNNSECRVLEPIQYVREHCPELIS